MEERKDSEIVFSKSIKAGKRIYYLDVKKSRNEDLYLAITESKKKVTGFDEAEQQQKFVLEKHKIFLYKEDFSNFVEGLEEVIGYIKSQVGEIEPRKPYVPQEEVAAAPAAEAAEVEGDDKDEKKSLFGKIFG